jgi:hypothetical protein
MMWTELITLGIVHMTYPFNAIFGRNIINKFAIVIHQSYLCMKIPTTGGILSVLCSQDEAQRCEDNTLQGTKNAHTIKENQQKPKGVRS